MYIDFILSVLYNMNIFKFNELKNCKNVLFADIMEAFMKFQTYFTTPIETMSDICDMSKDICINCVGAVDDSIRFNTNCIRNDYYMMYVIKGQMNIKFDSFDGTIASGDLLILKPGTVVVYSSEIGSGINYLWLHFTGKKAENILIEASLPTNKIIRCSHIGSIVDCWKRMCNEFVMNDKFFDQSTVSIFSEILIAFSRRINISNNKRRLLKSTLYIHENYHKKIDISFLASMENLSQSHYRALFLQMFGESPIEYIISKRIEAAIYFLENSDKKLSEIAPLVGYNDVYYFGRQFKRKTGISPGKYRKTVECLNH